MILIIYDFINLFWINHFTHAYCSSKCEHAFIYSSYLIQIQ